jgi:GNAT superfamily N-acetyltransferase
MWFRLPPAEFAAAKGDGNRRRLRQLVRTGTPPGVVAYRGREPVGWCAVAPRADYPRLGRSRVLAPVDDQPVWAVTCFFVARAARGAGVTRALLEGAATFAARHGARWLEGYPVDARTRQADAFVYHGLASTFTAAGFREVARRSATRPIMRRALGRAARG